SGNKAHWNHFRPEFVKIEADWDGILESWMKVECVRRSKVGARIEKGFSGM
nr:GRAS protein [Tanacetum cinerariifolium]